MNNLFYEHYDIEEMHELRQSSLRLAASTRMLMNLKQLSTQTGTSSSVTSAESQQNISQQFVRDLAAVQVLTDKAALYAQTGLHSGIPTPTGSQPSTSTESVPVVDPTSILTDTTHE